MHSDRCNGIHKSFFTNKLSIYLFVRSSCAFMIVKLSQKVCVRINPALIFTEKHFSELRPSSGKTVLPEDCIVLFISIPIT